LSIKFEGGKEKEMNVTKIVKTLTLIDPAHSPLKKACRVIVAMGKALR